jgi:hypothetical protein
MRETPAGVQGRGDPTGAKRRGGSPERPRTARAWSGNQLTSLTQPKINKGSEIRNLANLNYFLVFTLPDHFLNPP